MVMGRSFWISLVLVLAVLVGWMINSYRLNQRLEVSNANAAMYDVAAEIMQFQRVNNALPEDLKIKYTSQSGGGTTVYNEEDAFAGFRRRWPNVSLVTGMEQPNAYGVTIIYNPGECDFSLAVYIGNRLINQRKYE